MLIYILVSVLQWFCHVRSGASSAICHYSETALQTAFLIPDQKKKAPFLIMCPRPKGMHDHCWMSIAIETVRIYNFVK